VVAVYPKTPKPHKVWYPINLFSKYRAAWLADVFQYFNKVFLWCVEDLLAVNFPQYSEIF
jgi:hypothetical protein